MPSPSQNRPTHSCSATPAPNGYLRFTLKPSNLDLTDQQLIADLQRVARRLKTSAMTMRCYTRHGRVTALTISRRFHGWKRALIAAHLKPVKRSRVTPDQAIHDLQRVARKLLIFRILMSLFILVR